VRKGNPIKAGLPAGSNLDAMAQLFSTQGKQILNTA
jgi:hypothetical protein